MSKKLVLFGAVASLSAVLALPAQAHVAHQAPSDDLAVWFDGNLPNRLHNVHLRYRDGGYYDWWNRGYYRDYRHPHRHKHRAYRKYRRHLKRHHRQGWGHGPHWQDRYWKERRHYRKHDRRGHHYRDHDRRDRDRRKTRHDD